MDKDTIYAVHRLAEAVEYRNAMDKIKTDAYSVYTEAKKDAKVAWMRYYDRLHELERR